MPPAITVSPRRVTPSRAYCTAQTSSSPKPSPSRADVWHRRKNPNQNGLCNKFSYFTSFWRFRLGGEDGLQHTFCHLPGISVTTERQLWAAGIDSWEAALAVDRRHLPRRHQRALADHLPASIEHLARGNPTPFADGLPSHQHWRLFPAFRPLTAYVDIET